MSPKHPALILFAAAAMFTAVSCSNSSSTPGDKGKMSDTKMSDSKMADGKMSDDKMSDGKMAESASAAVPAKMESVKLTGAGASFPEPLYNQWFSDYTKTHKNVKINYEAIGSGGGITQLTKETVDFAASDAAMTDEEIAKVARGVQLLPMTAGAIVLAYNLPGVTDLKLTREAYVGMFLGKVKKWNDPLIADANPGVSLPEKDVTIVHRSDSSGTTFVFTKHLSAINADWKSGPGENKAPKWPTGMGGKQNAGVASTIQQTEGGVGYLELGYVKMANLPIAKLQNKAGQFVAPTTESMQAALASVEMPDNLIAWIPDPESPAAYPIVTYTWLLCYKDYSAKPGLVPALKDVIRYGLTEGQKVSESLGYIPLPEAVTSKVLGALENIKP